MAELDPDFAEGRTLNRKDVALGQRGDIIEFYNKIYINYIKDFVLKFQSPEEVSNLISRTNHSCTILLWILYAFSYELVNAFFIFFM